MLMSLSNGYICVILLPMLWVSVPASLPSYSRTNSTSLPTTNSSTPSSSSSTTTTTTATAPTTTTMASPTKSTQPMMQPDSWANMTANSTTTPKKPLSSGIQLCPNTTWQLDSNLCFLTVNISLTWSDASSYCHSLSSKLVIFDNDFIQQKLLLNSTSSSPRSLLGPFITRVYNGQWVGVHLVQGKLWWEADVPIKVFSDATSDIFIWNGSQPNGQDGGCGMVASSPYNKFVLKLAPCDGKRPFVCFRDPVETILEPIPQLCPPGWNGSVDSDFCYWTNPIPLSFQDAYQFCRALNATLAQPQTSNQNIFTLAAFENSVLINHTLGIQPLYWLGFINDTMNMTTVEGRPWLGSFNGFRRTSLINQGRKRRLAPPTVSQPEKLCVYMALYNFSYVSWLAGDCNNTKPSVCQLPASASGTPVVKLNNFSPSTTVRVQQLSDYTLTCSASNFHPSKQVVWVKDGIYIDNGLPPEGLTLYLGTNRTISQLDIYNTRIRGLLQGYYGCEVWGIGTDRISSDSILIIFEDVATFRGTIWGRSNISSAVLLLNVTYWSWDIFQVVNSSFYNNIFQSVDNFQIQFGELQLSSTCCNLTLNFTVYYANNINDASLTKLMSYLETQQPEVGTNSNNDWKWVLNDKIYQALLSSISAKLATPTNYVSIQIMPPPQVPPSINDVKLWRTDGCESGTIIDIGGATLHFPSTVYGQRMDSVEQCLPPAEQKAVATGQCTGDFMKGGSWNILSWIPCNNELTGSTSSVTQDLLSMYKGDVNSTNVDHVTSQLSNLTTNSSNLLPIDVILVSHILDNVASVKRIPTNIIAI